MSPSSRLVAVLVIGSVAACAAGDAWRPLAGQPQGCRIERALSLDAVLEPGWMRWTSCTPSDPACRTLVLAPRYDWLVNANGAARALRDTYVALQIHEKSSASVLTVVAGLAGKVLAAWRQAASSARPPLGTCKERCCELNIWLSPDVAAFDVQAFAGGGQGASAYRGSLNGLSQIEDPFVELGAPEIEAAAARAGGGSQAYPIAQLALSASTTVAQLDATHLAFLRPGKPLTLLRFYIPAPNGLFVFDDTLVLRVWDKPELDSARSGQDPAPYYAPDSAGVEALAGEGADLAWIQGYEETQEYVYTRCELWTGRYEQATSDFAPRMVATLNMTPERCVLPSVPEGRMGGGLYAIGRYPDVDPVALDPVVTIADLAAGDTRTYLPPHDAPWPIHISENEMLLSRQVDDWERGLARVDLSKVP